MASKPQSPGTNSTTSPSAKLPKPKKPTTSTQTQLTPSKQNVEKPQPPKTTPTATSPTTEKPRRKPRKLTRETPSTTTLTAPTPPATIPAIPAAADDLEALKARVRGLEAKVEELCRTGTSRSPRRRGKGRKNSSAATVPTLQSTGGKKEDVDNEGIGGRGEEEEEEADEELERVESELAGARRDLALFEPKGRQKPRGTHKTSTATAQDEDEDVEDIPTHRVENNRSVTLSGSYRIPLPATVSIDDVKTIQSGVSAAQNVARRVLEQRRAASSQNPGGSSMAGGDAGGVGELQGKKSWGEWIGGYSMAISRAVRSIEHEAAVEGRRGGSGGENARRNGGGGTGTRKKRPGVKATLSSEQVQGLMS